MTMKKLLLPVCLLLAGVINANAQGVAVGLRAGLNVANQSISASGVSISPDSRVSFLVGGYAKIMFSGSMGIQPELFYSSIGAKWPSSGSGVQTIKTDYLTLPVFFRYNITDNFHLLAGPQFGILMSAKGTDNTGTQDIKSSLNSSDISGVIGAGLDFGPINVGLRYNFGLSNIEKNATGGETIKNNVFQIVAGFKLFGK
jgi:hypothetical protein